MTAERREFCIELFLPSRCAEGRPLADRLRALNRLPPLQPGAGRISAAIKSGGLVVLEVTADTDDERLWDALKARLEHEAALIGRAATLPDAPPELAHSPAASRRKA